MSKTKSNVKMLTSSILSLSLLTVMAGAAVAPALGVIKEYFSGADPMLVQMVISIPAIFIMITNLIFPHLCGRFSSRTLVLAGLVLYTAGGVAAGLFSNIVPLLAARAIVGVGVGMIMPLSTGLLAFYFEPAKQEKLMGLSSAMNQMGGALATLLSGLLAAINWRASFLVYLMGLISIVLCLIFLPADKIHSGQAAISASNIKANYPYIVAIFLLMVSFFIYPSNFAIETEAEGIIPQHFIAIIMTVTDVVAFCSGLLFVRIKSVLGSAARFMAPAMFLIGYLLMYFAAGWIGAVAGSCFIGFANGEGVPFIISAASKRAGKAAATTVMPLISAALYLAQFVTPMLISGVTAALGVTISHVPFFTAIIVSICFLAWSTIVTDGKKEDAPVSVKSGEQSVQDTI